MSQGEGGRGKSVVWRFKMKKREIGVYTIRGREEGGGSEEGVIKGSGCDGGKRMRGGWVFHSASDLNRAREREWYAHDIVSSMIFWWSKIEVLYLYHMLMYYICTYSTWLLFFVFISHWCLWRRQTCFLLGLIRIDVNVLYDNIF